MVFHSKSRHKGLSSPRDIRISNVQHGNGEDAGAGLVGVLKSAGERIKSAGKEGRLSGQDLSN